MEIVKSTKNLEPLNHNAKDDFYKVPSPFQLLGNPDQEI